MYETQNVFDAALITATIGQTPLVAILPHLTGRGTRIIYRYPNLPEIYRLSLPLSHLAKARNLLERFDELNRLGIVTQKAHKEASR